MKTCPRLPVEVPEENGSVYALSVGKERSAAHVQIHP